VTAARNYQPCPCFHASPSSSSWAHCEEERTLWSLTPFLLHTSGIRGPPGNYSCCPGNYSCCPWDERGNCSATRLAGSHYCTVAWGRGEGEGGEKGPLSFSPAPAATAWKFVPSRRTTPANRGQTISPPRMPPPPPNRGHASLARPVSKAGLARIAHRAGPSAVTTAKTAEIPAAVA
jgi:hypothetical protein